jgi:signal transduction histidine kinase
MQNFVRIGINWLTLQYSRIRQREDAKKKAPKPQPSALDVIKDAKTKIQESTELTSVVKQEIISALNLASERVASEEEEFISELSMLRVLASTGVVVAMMNHQLRAVIDGIRGIYTDLSELANSIPKPIRAEYSETLQEMQEWRKITEGQVSQLGFLLGQDARKRRRQLPLRQVVDDVTKPLSLYMQDFGITVENNVPAGLRTRPIFEAELYALLLQIFTNALKAVREGAVRKISVEAYLEKKHLHIRMYDTGVGIPPEMRESVFRPFETTSTPDPVLGVGTGLGLWIVSELVKVYDGNAHFIEATKPWNTCIEVVIPDER